VIGRPIHTFAYPYGSLDGRSAEVVRCGWRWGLACQERSVALSFDAASVPRVEVKDWDVPEFAARLEGVFQGG
jgi:hypothetical protein